MTYADSHPGPYLSTISDWIGHSAPLKGDAECI